MARGFESKDVEYQQAEAGKARPRGAGISPVERERADHRRSIELALAKSRADLARATSDAHRRMLEHAIADLERQLTTHA